MNTGRPVKVAKHNRTFPEKGYVRSSLGRFMVRSSLAALPVLVTLFGASGIELTSRGAEAAFLTEVRKLLASDAQEGDFFGTSVAVSGDTAVVGARHEDSAGDNAGAAYVLERNAGGADNWGEVKKLTAADGEAGDQFGSVVAISGSTIVIGTYQEDAYLFERDAGGTDNWGEVKHLTTTLGISVAVSGDTVITGPGRGDLGCCSAGSAIVFQRDTGGTDSWEQVQVLFNSDPEWGDYFGGDVAISGDTLVVGARNEGPAPDGGPKPGAAYVFVRDEGDENHWLEVKKLIASDRAAEDRFGWSVAVAGDTVVVGANLESDKWPFQDENSLFPGAAYVYERNQGGTDNWGEVQKLIASGRPPTTFLGQNVAVSSDTIVAGTAVNAAYIFGRDEGGLGNWGEVDRLTSPDPESGDAFGFDVAVSSGTTVVTAHQDDFGGFRTGAAYVFETAQAGDADQDGCTNKAENGPDETIGGQRNNGQFWDFYDVWTHPPGDPVGWERNKILNVFDILAVGSRFGAGPQLSKEDALAAALTEPTDDTSYHPAYDRGPISGPNAWDRAPADGSINIIDDILGVVQQYGHDCT